MTPQERELISGLFDRLARLESQSRDPEAETAIAEDLKRAPNAIYPLVQTVLIQDEALKAAMRESRTSKPKRVAALFKASPGASSTVCAMPCWAVLP